MLDKCDEILAAGARVTNYNNGGGDSADEPSSSKQTSGVKAQASYRVLEEKHEWPVYAIDAQSQVTQ